MNRHGWLQIVFLAPIAVLPLLPAAAIANSHLPGALTSSAETNSPADNRKPAEPPSEPKPQTDQSGSPPDKEPNASDPAESRADEAHWQLLQDADELYRQGRRAEAEHLYRKAKGSFTGIEFADRPPAIFDPEQLPPAGKVYWREAQTGQELHLITRVLVPLGLLTEDYPEFIPGHLRYAEVLIEQDRPQEALAVLERATALYPEQVELARERVNRLAEQKRWLDASIAARQFALLNPDNPAAPEFTALAEAHLRTFKAKTRERLTGNAIANAVLGAASFALTGSLFGPFSAIDSTILLLRGEESVGNSVANQAKQQLPLIDDPEVVGYVNEIGQRLASVTGRSEFTYEFYVVRDPELNAFSLPGGKVFVNAGAIAATHSEAELAGLIAHELSHAVLSHGFQLVTSGNATANFLGVIPYVGSLATDLAVSGYSRDMERQADILGTQLLVSSGYAADGLHNLMLTLAEQQPALSEEDWLSTHPDTQERIRNLEALIERNGYNRYTYEGVERHRQIQERVERLMAEEKPEQEPASEPSPEAPLAPFADPFSGSPLLGD